MAKVKFNNFDINVNLGFLGITGKWAVDETQRNAAWDIYVELVTRISVVELKADEGILREALSSIYTIFGTTRAVLKKYGPEVATPGNPEDTTLGHVAIEVLNKVLRPLLSKWHPLLKDYENEKSEDVSVTMHERKWEHAVELRGEINKVRKHLSDYVDVLAQVAGVSKLH